MELLRFRRKQGLGVHRFRSAGSWIIAKAGDVVTCSRKALGKCFDQYECLDELPLESIEQVEARTPEIIPNSIKGWFDVVNPDYPDRPLNDKKMRKADAIKFLELLVNGSN